MSENAELLLVEDSIWLLVSPTGLPIYDFSFRDWFHTRSPHTPPPTVTAIARIGSVSDYAETYALFKSRGVVLANSPEEHRRASELEGWYPVLNDITPRTVCFSKRPTLDEVRAHFDWPIFMKGARQTSRHERKLAIIESDADFLMAIEQYAVNPILKWQSVACREFVPLRRVSNSDTTNSKVPRRFEFRTFWWNGRFVGAGRYWWEGPEYRWTESERVQALHLADEAARRVAVPFLVVDVAMTESGRWIVIECNDGQESGYAGVSPFAIWQRIVEIEKEGKIL